MQLKNSFDVPLPPDRAWAVLMDIERIAPCMPGAELLETIDPETYRGRVSVRLGPVALTFVGTAKFEAVDAAGRTARVKAQGSDAKGRGGANATVTFGLEPSGAGTRVNVDTDLSLSGGVAQYGRGVGMIQSVAGQLIGQFAKNLKAEIESEPAPAAAGPAAPAEAPAARGAPGAAA
ncbi:SRPBCC family protein, partial [Propylenella binzhouense]